MSDQGWRAFLDAQDLDDWVVLHGGPTAVFKTASLTEAAALAVAISDIPGINQPHVQISLVSDALTIRLTREVLIMEPEHLELARQISSVAAAHGAVAAPNRVQEVQLAIAAKPDAIDLPFWRAILGYSEMQPDNAVDPLGISSTVWMQEIDAHKSLRHAMHLDVSVAKEHFESRLAAALAAGGVVVDDSESPSFCILADRSGNKVCLVSWPDGAKAKAHE
jgi:4a-hydroxytetrahydrobiopterin dehydratase